jgi:outer membrane usher protein FimD/PapC
MLSREYVAAGAAANVAWPEAGRSLYGQLLASSDSARGLSGVQASTALGQSLGRDVRLGLSANLRTSGYRALQEAQAYHQAEPHLPSGYRSQLGATLGVGAGAWGSFSAGLTHENYFWGEPGQVLSLGWSKSWRGGVSLNASLSRSTARSYPASPLNPGAGTVLFGGSDFAYVGLSIPLGTSITSRSFAQKTDDTTRVGTSINHRVNEYVSYTASAEQSSRAGHTSDAQSLTASLLPRYASVSLGITQGQGYQSTYGEISGALLATGAGLAFSPYAVQDSFATVSTGKVTGVRLDTPQGPVWSGPGGLAAVPALAPYYESRIEVAGRSVALDVEVDNGLQVVQAGRGAVLQLDAGVRRVSRLMLTVTGPDGQPLPAGTAILRGGNEFFTAVAGEGRVLVTDMKKDDIVYAELASGQRCTLQDVRTAPKADDELFQMGQAVCK